MPKLPVKISIAQLKKRVQRKVNAFVRERDKDELCISCGCICPKGDAGHYISQGSNSLLRFNLDNLNKQCLSCNRFKHGNLVMYRIGLVRKIGEKRVKYLEDNVHTTKKWTREELEQILESL